jgi:hypothetical protein
VNAALKACLAIVLVAFVSACSDLTTDHPVGAASDEQFDKRLVGGWQLLANPDMQEKHPHALGYAFFLPLKNGVHAVVMSWGDDASDGGCFEFDAVTGKADDDLFLNVLNPSDCGKAPGEGPPGYHIYLYRFDARGGLMVTGPSQDGRTLVARAVNGGRLKGTVKVTSYGTDAQGHPNSTTDIRLTAEQKALDAFFAENGKAIFTDPIVTAKRVPLP